MLDRKNIDEALRITGELLARAGASVTIVVIGGAAMIRHAPDRPPTIDVDIIARREEDSILPGEPMPAVLTEAAAAVASTLDLPAGWLNAESAMDFASGLPLPEGLIGRCAHERYGGLEVLYADRHDLVAFKLLAAMENFTPGNRTERHRHDLRRLDPRPAELKSALAWIELMVSPASASHRMLEQLLVEEEWREQ